MSQSQPAENSSQLIVSIDQKEQQQRELTTHPIIPNSFANLPITSIKEEDFEKSEEYDKTTDSPAPNSLGMAAEVTEADNKDNRTASEAFNQLWKESFVASSLEENKK